MSVVRKVKDTYLRYSLEVFPIYMLTSTEAAICNFIATIFLSLLIFGLFFYLPRHFETVLRKGYYYCTGGHGGSSVAGDLAARAEFILNALRLSAGAPQSPSL
ncbi:hypothetical protein DV451_002443 [Geotrichum candidum]|uniref:Uncharacterized protein n=1 Tax=Geotrichum candidum TaxID=1173061 RepID=A0A9P5KUG6_GEOCN|nr:hypothetical protein DV451_002443 [Geotrichum candidum]KAF5111552.1 hypothetical protein DV453_000197 [Geotrichum candidum]